MVKIVIAALKGGVGKSTLAIHLGGALAQIGRVGLIDTDPQQSLAAFRARRESPSPAITSCSAETLQARLDQARRGGLNYVIIDSPPQNSAGVAACLREADMVLIPTRPALLDLEAVATTVEIVRNLNLPFGVVLNGAPPRRNGFEAPLVVEARQRLRGIGARLWKGQITHRLALIYALIDGLTIQEAEPVGPSTREIGKLMCDLLAEVGQVGGAL